VIVERERRPAKRAGIERGTIRADHDRAIAAAEHPVDRMGHPLTQVAALLRMQRDAEIRGARGEERVRRVGRAPELRGAHARLDRRLQRTRDERRVQPCRAFLAQLIREPRLHAARHRGLREYRDARGAHAGSWRA
jgi:hypothetical protein